MRKQYWTLGVALAALMGCDVFKLATETQLDRDYVRCSADPAAEGCAAFVLAWCRANPDDAVRCGEPSVEDAGEDAASDTGAEPDGAEDPDAGQVDACACGAEAPLCVADGGCATCTSQERAACTGETDKCDEEMGRCVACLDDDHCPTSELGACLGGACSKCTDDPQCKHLGQVCDESSGRCVNCTVDAEVQQCGEFSCDPASHACTGTRVGSVKICMPCVADSECEDGYGCIPMYFGAGDTKKLLGGRCMLKATEIGCPAPYGGTPLVRPSLSGAAAQAYCGISEVRTSCEAILSLSSRQLCTKGQEAACGAGGRCETVNTTGNRCTYACISDDDCLLNATCPSGGLGGYCGQPQ